MSNIEVKNAEGASVKTVELDSRVFGIEPNIPVVHHVVVNYLSCLRQGTHDTKGRSEVSGGGKKPWRQKGTGRARQGSIRATQWVGGGVPFGPTPRSHYKRTNKKEIKLAMRSVLSGKLADGELFLVDSIDFGDEPKTKKAKALLESLGIADKRVTVVVPSWRQRRPGQLAFQICNKPYPTLCPARRTGHRESRNLGIETTGRCRTRRISQCR